MSGKRELKVEKKAGRLWLAPVAAAVVLAAGTGGLCALAATNTTIEPNTVAAGVDLGGMTPAEAKRALKPALSKLGSEQGVRLTLEGGAEAAYLSYDELGAVFDADKLAQAAYARGRSGNLLADGLHLLGAYMGKEEAISPEPEDGWQERAAELLAEQADLSAEDFSYQVEQDSLLLTKARNGRDVDKPTLRARLNAAKADAEGQRSVDLPYRVVEADPGNLQKLSEELGGRAANASYDKETGGIRPERSALSFDVDQAQSLLNAAAPGETVSVATESHLPSITADELKEVLFRDVLGTYTTRVGGAAGRKANVKLTASRVNGVVLNSGEVFNYYDYCGPFSAANGYQSAPGYLHGKTVEMDGGGACQCSSTAYAAALLANLEIVARTNHGFASDYIGLGMDATVSGGGPDFIFRNNTDYPIKIEAVYSNNNRLTVTIRGTKTDKTTVKMRTEVLSTTPYSEQTIVSNELAPGERKVDQTPYTGYLVETYREIYDENGNLLSSKLEARSKYNKRDRIVLVGPAPAAPAAAPAENVSETPPAPAETPAQTPAVETPPAQETPVQEAPVQEAPVQEPAAQEAPAEQGGVDPWFANLIPENDGSEVTGL